MKKMLLFIAAGLLMMTTAQANEILVNQDNSKGELTRYRNAQPVLFALNGIDYAVFPDGRVEYELPRSSQTYGDRSSNYRRYNVNRRSTDRSRGFVSYNRSGQVTKIGDTRISYFASGQVARIGHLSMDYTRRGGVLNQVGGLQVRYNRNGKLVAARGQVNLRDRLSHSQDFGHFNDNNTDDWDDGVFFKRTTTK